MQYLKGDEDLKDIIVLAYGMEEGLRSFYATVSKRTEDPDVSSLSNRLSEVEERHKERLFTLYVSNHSSIAARDAFESEIVAGVMEGGFTTEEFMKKHHDAMNTVPDLLNIAMMLETQALDLYMRYSEKAADAVVKGVLYDLAEEEKGHLASLGKLMEEKV